MKIIDALCVTNSLYYKVYITNLQDHKSLLLKYFIWFWSTLIEILFYHFMWNQLYIIPKYCHFDSSQFFQIMGLKNSTINKLEINYSKYLYYFNLGVPTKNGIINKNQTFWNCFGQLSEKASNLSKSQIIRSTALTFYISLKWVLPTLIPR